MQSWIVFILTLSNCIALARSQKVEDEFLMRLKAGTGINHQNASDILPHDTQLVEIITDDLVLVRKKKTNQIHSSSIESLSNPNVHSVQPNHYYYLEGIESLGSTNDPKFSSQWNLEDGKPTGDPGAVDINVLAAWTIETGRPDVVVAIIDTGMEMDHPDLKDRVWTNNAEKEGQPGVDDDGNGYVDDIHGYDFTRNRGSMSDSHGHGTHVAGIVGAAGSNRVGISGVAQDVRIMPLKVVGSQAIWSYEHKIIRAINYAVKNGAQVINMSLNSGSYSAELKRSIQRAEEANVTVVTSAGNAARNNDRIAHYPSNYDLDNVLAVAGINKSGKLPRYRNSKRKIVGSNYGVEQVDIAAPGWSVLSTYKRKRYYTLSGTSMASPHVAGVAALLYSRFPGINYREVRRRILSNAKPMPSLEGKVASQGLLDAFAALVDDQSIKVPQILKKTIAVTGFESPHRYPANANITKSYSVDGAIRFRLYFEKIDLERRDDYIYIRDKEGKLVQKLTGRGRGYWSKTISGDSVSINLRSDHRRQRYGYKVTRIEYYYEKK